MNQGCRKLLETSLHNNCPSVRDAGLEEQKCWRCTYKQNSDNSTEIMEIGMWLQNFPLDEMDLASWILNGSLSRCKLPPVRECNVREVVPSCRLLFLVSCQHRTLGRLGTECLYPGGRLWEAQHSIHLTRKSASVNRDNVKGFYVNGNSFLDCWLFEILFL